MKKQIKKLDLNKRTITNLDLNQMDTKVGGKRTNGNNCATNAHTCGLYCTWTQGNYTCGRTCGSF